MMLETVVIDNLQEHFTIIGQQKTKNPYRSLYANHRIIWSVTHRQSIGNHRTNIGNHKEIIGNHRTNIGHHRTS